MKKIILSFVVAASLLSCKKEHNASGSSDHESQTPECIQRKIEIFQQQIPVCPALYEDKKRNVKKYLFQNQIVYVFYSGNCTNNSADEVIDSGCNELGWLRGISGNATINGEDFSNAVFIETIWEEN